MILQGYMYLTIYKKNISIGKIIKWNLITNCFKLTAGKIEQHSKRNQGN